jgi:tRNA pseudouridine38-40 synthase
VQTLKFYKASLSYDGKDFFGWQKQPDQRTVQGELEKVVALLANNQEIQVIGSGRTDTGVHALDQVIKISAPLSMGAEALMRALNSMLPDDIQVNWLEEVSNSFQPVFDAKKKTYMYYFSTSKNILPTHRGLLTYLFAPSFDLNKAQSAAAIFVGEHDFGNFHTVGTPVKSTVREVFECRVEKVEAQAPVLWPQYTYVMTITGTGFLKQMVRLIMATIWSAAQGKIQLSDISRALANPSVEKLAPTAPPEGLYLYKVFY